MNFIKFYYEDCHKVLNIFGIKIKFFSEKQWLLKQFKQISSQSDRLYQEQFSKINKITNLLNLVQSELIETQEDFNNGRTMLEQQNENCIRMQTMLDRQQENFVKVQTILENLQEKYIKIQTILDKQQENVKTLQVQNDRLKLQCAELNFRNVLIETISTSEWLKCRAFTLRGGAANYSFIFSLYMILDLIKPENILEFGIGQTSLVTTQFAKFYDKDLTIVEHNQDWIDIFSKKLDIGDKTKIAHKNLINFLCDGEHSEKYESLDDITKDKKFNLIIIDGPIGVGRKYPRTNILDLIPQNLSENFVIILDDAERDGEKNTANLIFKALDENNILYSKSYKSALKTQLIISSLNYDFIHYY